MADSDSNIVQLSVLSEGSVPLSRLPSVSKLFKQDLFFIERNGFLAISALFQEGHDYSPIFAVRDENGTEIICLEGGVLSTISHYGCRITYEQLSSRLFYDIANRLNLQSMAFKEDYMYSLRNHTHQYSSVSFYPSYSFDDIAVDYAEESSTIDPHGIPEWLGTVEIYQNGISGYTPVSVDFYMPYYKQITYSDPDVGEMRVLARSYDFGQIGNPQLTVVNGQEMFYDSENGGYWVYPRGQTITCDVSDFRAACAVYGPNMSENDIRFTIPLFDSFVKMNPGLNTSDPILSVGWHNGLVAHNDHQIDNTSFSSGLTRLTGEVTIPTTVNAWSNAIHSGAGRPISTHKVACLSADDIPISNVKNNNTYTDYSAASLDRETYPDYINTLTIVYIGRK